MKKWVLILIVLVVVAGGYFLFFSKKDVYSCKDDSECFDICGNCYNSNGEYNPLPNEGECAPPVHDNCMCVKGKCELVESSCLKAGQGNFGGPPAPNYVFKECCEGLESVEQKVVIDGECKIIPDMGWICTNCGDNICENWENECNCEEDCKDNLINYSEDCIKSGGEWEIANLPDDYICVYYYSDAGKSCNSSDECLGDCRAYNKSGVSTCAVSSNPFGCFSRIEEFNENGLILCRD